MVDTPTTTPDPNAIASTAQAADAATVSFTNMGNATEKASSLLNGMTAVSTAAHGVLDKLESELGSVGIKLNNLSSLSEAQTKQFGLLSAAVLGVRDSYEGLAGISTDNMSTFTSQLNELATVLKDSPGFAIATESVQDLVNMLVKAHAPLEQIQEAAKKGAGGLIEYAKSVLQSADNANRMQNAFVQMSAKTGNLNELLKAAGPNLERMNFLLDQQASIMNDTGKATGLSADQVEKYWAELGKIPGALQSVVDISGKGTRSTSTLTAAIEMARGSGRDYKDVVDDLSLAFKDYGIVGEQALTFSARMTDVANKLKAPFDEVRNAIRGSAEQFKMFATAGADAAKQGEQIADAMVKYGSALQGVGLSASNSIGVVQQMLGNVKDMRIEQKAFLSQQTGGPGGLMGGFQIEKMMREGDTGKVLDKMMESMKKQMGGGKVVNFDEASQSQMGAQQYERQIRLMTQGPTKIVNDRESAERLIDAMRAKQDGRPDAAGLAKNVLQDQMKTGVDIQKQSYTELTKISQDISSIRRHADIANRMTAQSSFSAVAGTPTDITGATMAQRKQRSQLSQTMKKAETKGGTDTDMYNNNITSGSATGKNMHVNMLKDVKDLFNTVTKDMPDAVKATIDGLRQAINAGDPKQIQNQQQRLMADIASRKKSLNDSKSKMSQQDYNSALQQIQGEETAVAVATNQLQAAHIIGAQTTTGKPQGTTRGATTSTTPQIGTKGVTAPTAGGQVRTAARANANTAAAATPHVGGPAGPTQAQRDLNVHVTGTFQVQMPDGSTQTVSPNMRATYSGPQQ